MAQQGLLRASTDAGIEASELSAAKLMARALRRRRPDRGWLAAGACCRVWELFRHAGQREAANVGHAEPAAGATGLLKLLVQLRAGECAPNAQLTFMNPHVRSALEGLACSLPQQLVRPAGGSALAGGVGSFGYSGTIVYAVLAHCTSADPACSHVLAAQASRSYRRRAFPFSKSSSETKSSSSKASCTSLNLPERTERTARHDAGHLVRLTISRSNVAILELNDIPHFNALGVELSDDLAAALPLGSPPR